MPKFERAAVLGAGVIGASWASLFLARGITVDIFDPAEGAEAEVRGYVARAWPALARLGLAPGADPERLIFHKTPMAAVREASFVQESVPERLDVKHALFAEIEPHLAPDAIVASSASGLMVSEMQQGWRDPSRFLLGHPFNPPHLIPLVELFANDRTAEGVLQAAEDFYKEIGKVTIRLEREIPGHVANRLQAALWREAIHLVASGVASVEDVDKAVWAGPGLRWAVMGPHMLFHLAAGPGGMADFCERYRDSMHRWWAGLGAPELAPEVTAVLAQGVAEEARGMDMEALSAKRDTLLLAVLDATKDPAEA
jgi:3-hydroxybutyryl-CoA dehydrogenase